MELLGQIHNGVVVLDGGTPLPEGTRVSVSPVSSIPPFPETEIVCEAGKLPYVHGGIPGTWHLTNEMIAQIFEEEDLEKMTGMWNAPS